MCLPVTELCLRCAFGFNLLWRIMTAACAVGSCVFILSAQDCISQVSWYTAPTDILDPPTEQTRSDSALCDAAAHAATPFTIVLWLSWRSSFIHLILRVETKTSRLNQMTVPVNRLNQLSALRSLYISKASG